MGLAATKSSPAAMSAAKEIVDQAIAGNKVRLTIDIMPARFVAGD